MIKKYYLAFLFLLFCSAYGNKINCGNLINDYDKFIIFQQNSRMDSIKYYQKKLIVCLTYKIASLESNISKSTVSAEIQEPSEKSYEKEDLKEKFETICETWQGNGLENCLFDLLDEFPQAPIILKSLGNCYYKKRDWPRAIEYYKYYLMNSPKDQAVLLKLSLSLENSNKKQEALRIIRALIEASPQEEYYYKVCLRLAENELLSIALRWEKIYLSDQKNTVLKKHLINAWTRLGRNDKIQAILSREGKEDE